MTRRDRAREVLARAYEAAGYGDEATAFRAGMWTCHDHPALAAILAFADAELERAVDIADTGVTRCLQKVDGRGLNDAKWIRDAIRAMKEE